MDFIKGDICECRVSIVDPKYYQFFVRYRLSDWTGFDKIHLWKLKLVLVWWDPIILKQILVWNFCSELIFRRKWGNLFSNKP